MCSCVYVCVDMLMTLFLPYAQFFIICHVHARCGGDVWPLIGATATSTNDVFFATDETATLHESYTKKTADFRSPTMFFRAVATKKR